MTSHLDYAKGPRDCRVSGIREQIYEEIHEEARIESAQSCFKYQQGVQTRFNMPWNQGLRWHVCLWRKDGGHK